VLQVTPVCPHKLLPTFQLKIPLDLNEVYQFANIVCSSSFKAPIS